MKTTFKILILALALGTVTSCVFCRDDNSDTIDGIVCEGVTQEECGRLL